MDIQAPYNIERMLYLLTGPSLRTCSRGYADRRYCICGRLYGQYTDTEVLEDQQGMAVDGGWFHVQQDLIDKMHQDLHIVSAAASDSEVLKVIKVFFLFSVIKLTEQTTFDRTGVLIDPHTVSLF